MGVEPSAKFPAGFVFQEMRTLTLVLVQRGLQLVVGRRSALGSNSQGVRVLTLV